MGGERGRRQGISYYFDRNYMEGFITNLVGNRPLGIRTRDHLKYQYVIPYIVTGCDYG
jgi:hypothetical protein